MASVIKKFGKLLNKQQKKKLVILFLIMLLGAFLEALGVSLVIPLIAAIMQPDIIESSALAQWLCVSFGLQTHKVFVKFCIAALIGIYICKDLFLVFQSYALAQFAHNGCFETQKNLLQAFLMRPYEYYLDANSGEMIRTIQENAKETYRLLTTLLNMASESVVSAALIVTLFLAEPMMTAVIALSLGVMMLSICRIIRPVMRRVGKTQLEYYALAYMWLAQAFHGMKEIKAARRESFFVEQYGNSRRHLMKADKINEVLRGIPRLLMELGIVCTMLISLAVMIEMGKDTKTLIPMFGAFAMAALKLLPAANHITSAHNHIAHYEPELDQVLAGIQFLGQGTEHSTDRAAVDHRHLTLGKAVVMEHITYRYPNSDQDVFQDVNMIIPAGKAVGIVGPSGAGKTTAVNILLGLLRPQTGRILSDGMDVMEHYQEWLSLIGYIPQSVFLMDGTIRTNVTFDVTKGADVDEHVWHALEEAQLAEFVRSLPEGLDTQIGERGIRLSGGQQQRIGIARALYSNPELLIFDEATSSLDQETEMAVMEAIHRFKGTRTMVIIAHRLQTIENCDIVYRVTDASIQRER